MKKRLAAALILAVVPCLVSGCIVKEKESATDTNTAVSTEAKADAGADKADKDSSAEAAADKSTEAAVENSTEAAVENSTEMDLTGSTEADAAGSSRAASASRASLDPVEKGSGQVVVYNWGEYMDPDVIKQFEEESGIKVIYDEFETNEIMYPKVAAGASQYDLICPSDYMIAKMIDNDMLQPINLDHIPNYDNIDPEYIEKSKGFDPENKYSVPYCWGTVGILYNTTMVDEPVDSWEILWDEKYKDSILMQDSVRDTFMIPEMILGYDVNTVDEKEISASADLLIEQKPLVQAYVIDQVRDKMIGEEAALGVIYSGEAIYTKRENENLEYVIPKEGSNVWIDSWVMPKNARNVENAEKFLNFLCRADIALKNFEYITYSTPNMAARELIEDEEIRNSTVAFPTEDMLSRCVVFTYIGEDGDALYNEYWDKVKSK